MTPPDLRHAATIALIYLQRVVARGPDEEAELLSAIHTLTRVATNPMATGVKRH